MRIIKENLLVSGLEDLIVLTTFGGVFVYPTETCYGLGCDAQNTQAVKKIYTIKRRPEEKSLIVVVDTLERIRPFVEITSLLKKINDKYWPGALTVVVPVRKDVNLPRGVVSADGTIAFRVTSHPFASTLVEKLGRPIVSTSANIAGEANPYDMSEILNSFGGADEKPDVVIDAGRLPEKKPSTLVKLQGANFVVIRQGEINFNPDIL